MPQNMWFGKKNKLFFLGVQKTTTQKTKTYDLENDDLENDDLENDDLENNDLENDDLENDDLENNDLENDDLENNDLENDDLESDDSDEVARRSKGLERYRGWEIRGRQEGIIRGERWTKKENFRKIVNIICTARLRV